jgi:uncharacterized protein (TIGR02996 family)
VDAVAARKLLAELVKSEQLEVRRVDPVAKDLAAFMHELGRPPSARELDDWLGEQPMVTESYASESVLEDAIARHLAPPVAVEVAEARHPELERAIADSPETVEPYQVYSDWLQEQGDPFGELIALGIAGESERVERLRQHNFARWFGTLTKDHARRVQLHWKHGVVAAIEETVEHGVLGPYEWVALLRARACGFVRSIRLLQPCTPELDAVLSAHAAPTLRELGLYVSGPLPERILARDLHTLALRGRSMAIDPARLPRSLDRLELRLDELTTETSLALDIRTLQAPLSSQLARQLSGSRLPKLEHLIVVEPSSDLAEALAALELPALTHLELRDGRLDPGALALVTKLSLAKRLTALSLINVELGDRDADLVAAVLADMPLVTAFDVSENELTRAGLATLAKLSPKTTRQHRPGNSAERRIRTFAGSRLVAAEGISDPKLWRNAGVEGNVRWARYRGDDLYELFITTDLQRYGCTCPSSIQPCKHVVALALVAERTPLRTAPSEGIEGRIDRYDRVTE